MDIYSVISVVLMALYVCFDMVYMEKCPERTLSNGRTRMRSKGKMMTYRCKKGYKLDGPKFTVCLKSGMWTAPMPHCVGRGCKMPPPQKNLILEKVPRFGGGILQFSCAPGLRRSGVEQIWCNGTDWSDAPPLCLEGMSMGCDFESGDNCGWNHDVTDDFDWMRDNGGTPTANTGPKVDHTTGTADGTYLFMESSSPQDTGHKARLISPPYEPNKTKGLCLEFFYHMFGTYGEGEVGELDVFVKPQDTPTSGLSDAMSVFHRHGNQGDAWLRADVDIPELGRPFEIVFQGTRLSGWVSDIAIDDIRLFNCSERPQTTTVLTTTLGDTDDYYDAIDELFGTTPPTVDTTTDDLSTATPTPQVVTITTQSISPTPRSTVPVSKSSTVQTSTTPSPTTPDTSTHSATTPTTPTPTTTSSSTATAITATPTTTPTTTPKTTTSTTLKPSTGGSKRSKTKPTTITVTKPSAKPGYVRTSKKAKYYRTTKSPRLLGNSTSTTKTPGLLGSSESTPGFPRDPCFNVECQNGAQCQAPADRPYCVCPAGFRGEFCEFGRDPCFEFKCQNSGECKAPDDQPYCLCLGGFHGEKCEKPPVIVNSDDLGLHAGSTEGVVAQNGDGAGSSSSSSMPELPSLIVGIVAGLMIASFVIAVGVWKWSRRMRRKDQKEEDDQMNIITDYVETSLSVSS